LSTASGLKAGRDAVDWAKLQTTSNTMNAGKKRNMRMNVLTGTTVDSRASWLDGQATKLLCCSAPLDFVSDLLALTRRIILSRYSKGQSVMIPRNDTAGNGSNGSGIPKPRAEWIASRKAKNTDGNFSQMRY